MFASLKKIGKKKPKFIITISVKSIQIFSDRQRKVKIKIKRGENTTIDIEPFVVNQTQSMITHPVPSNQHQFESEFLYDDDMLQPKTGEVCVSVTNLAEMQEQVISSNQNLDFRNHIGSEFAKATYELFPLSNGNLVKISAITFEASITPKEAKFQEFYDQGVQWRQQKELNNILSAQQLYRDSITANAMTQPQPIMSLSIGDSQSLGGPALIENSSEDDGPLLLEQSSSDDEQMQAVSSRDSSLFDDQFTDQKTESDFVLTLNSDHIDTKLIKEDSQSDDFDSDEARDMVNENLLIGKMARPSDTANRIGNRSSSMVSHFRSQTKLTDDFDLPESEHKQRASSVKRGYHITEEINSLIANNATATATQKSDKRLQSRKIEMQEFVEEHRVTSTKERTQANFACRVQEYSDDSSSMDSEDSQGQIQLQKIYFKANQATIKLGTKIRATLYDNACSVTLVHMNEIERQIDRELIIEQASQLLSFSDEFYDVKRKLVELKDFSKLNENLFKVTTPAHPYHGTITCICIHLYKSTSVVFVGNSAGYVRVFSLNSEKEKQPFFDEQLKGFAVNAIDVSEDGSHVIGAYKSGKLALFEIQDRNKLSILMPNMTINRSEEFSAVKFLSNDNGVIVLLTAEKFGRVNVIKLTKKTLLTFHTGYDMIENPLYMKTHTNLCTVSVRLKSTFVSQTSEILNKACLTAIAGSDKMSIVQLRNLKPKELLMIQKPFVCEPNRSPTVTWGYGKVPTNSAASESEKSKTAPTSAQETMPLAAFAWDQIVQLLVIKCDQSSQKITVEKNGYYCSAHRIDQVYFMAESVLVIVINKSKGQKEIKVLRTDLFKAGSVDKFEDQKQQGRDITETKAFKTEIADTHQCELEVDHTIKGINISDDAKVNYNSLIYQHKKVIIAVGRDKIHQARLSSWKEFIEKIRAEKNWLTVLRVAVDVFRGKVKGLALLPDQQKRRDIVLRQYMRDLILNSVKSAFQDSAKAIQICQSSKLMMDKMAIKVGIEFCLQTKDSDYLFKSLYPLFDSKGQSKVFHEVLCSLAHANQLREVRIPECNLKKMVQHYKEIQDMDRLEKLIIKLDMRLYQRQDSCIQESKQSVRAYLEEVCEKNFLINAMINLKISDTSEERDVGCAQMLKTWFDKLNPSDSGNLRTDPFAQLDNECVIGKKDLQTMRNSDKTTKKNIEESQFYLTYRLFLMIRDILRGKILENRKLDDEQYRAHVQDVADFVTRKEVLEYLLDFDPDAFFQTVLLMLTGKPLNYITVDKGERKFDFQEKGCVQLRACKETELLNRSAIRNARPSEFNLSKSLQLKKNVQAQNIKSIRENICEEKTVKDMLYIFKTHASESDLKLTCFLELLLSIVIEQNDNNQSIQVSHTWIFAALKQVIHGKVAKQEKLDQVQDSAYKNEVNQDLIVKTLKVESFYLNEQSVDELLELARNSELDLIAVKIALFEKKGWYEDAFSRQLDYDCMKNQVFEWIRATFKKLEHQYKQEQYKRKQDKEREVDNMAIVLSDAKSEFTQPTRKGVSFLRNADSVEQTQIPAKLPSKLSLNQLVLQEEEQNDINQPLEKLKKSVKSLVLQLAKIDCKKTVQLVKDLLNDDKGKFEENLIMIRMNEAADFEESQYDYLEAFFKNETNEALAIEEIKSLENQSNVKSKYLDYILKFVKLICKLEKKPKNKLEKGCIEHWVSKSYFPELECKNICQQEGNLRGLVVLYRRLNKHEQAIEKCIEVIKNKIPINELVLEIELMLDHQPAFLQETVFDEVEGKWVLVAAEKRKQTKNMLNPPCVAEFDEYLGKACDIVIDDKLDQERRKKCWFMILEFLTGMKKESEGYVGRAFNKAKSLVYNDNFSVLESSRVAEYQTKLKQFVTNRINYILLFPRLDVPVKDLMEQLNLNLKQIQMVCKVKLKDNETEMKIQESQQSIIQSQMLDMFKDNFAKMSMGYVIEANKAYVVSSTSSESKPTAKKQVKGNTICNACKQQTVDLENQQLETIYVYMCSHQFHAHCLRKCMENIQYKKCPLCIEQNYLAVKEEKDRQERRQRRELGANLTFNKRKNDSDEGDEDSQDGYGQSDDESDGYTFNVDEEEDPQQILKQLMEKRMEQYDKVVDDINLELKEFEAMVADDM